MGHGMAWVGLGRCMVWEDLGLGMVWVAPVVPEARVEQKARAVQEARVSPAVAERQGGAGNAGDHGSAASMVLSRDT